MISHKIINSIKEATCENCIYSDGINRCYLNYCETSLPFKPSPQEEKVKKEAWCPDGMWIVPGDYYWQYGKIMTFQEISIMFLKQ